MRLDRDRSAAEERCDPRFLSAPGWSVARHVDGDGDRQAQELNFEAYEPRT